ncbi:MAG: hypothetical protein V2I27_01045 [Erythrobacter sp.]|nr:hypothetical protein [Erythrobacter sp.]
MSFWTAIVIIAAIWGFVTIWTRRHDHMLGVTRDEDGNPVFAPRPQHEIEADRREIENLRERIQVLERIATDANSADARERERIAAEIDALRRSEDVLASDIRASAKQSSKEDLSE